MKSLVKDNRKPLSKITSTCLCCARLIFQLLSHVSGGGIAVDGEVNVVAVTGGVAGTEVAAKEESIGKKKARENQTTYPMASSSTSAHILALSTMR
jgi:hypothetical protein